MIFKHLHLLFFLCCQKLHFLFSCFLLIALCVVIFLIRRRKEILIHKVVRVLVDLQYCLAPFGSGHLFSIFNPHLCLLANELGGWAGPHWGDRNVCLQNGHVNSVAMGFIFLSCWLLLSLEVDKLVLDSLTAMVHEVGKGNQTCAWSAVSKAPCHDEFVTEIEQLIEFSLG